MKFAMFFIALLCAGTGVALAQDTKASVTADPFKSAGVYYVYDYKDEPELTSAPKGFEPVYISHFGRHGARYCRSEYDSMYAWLAKAQKAGMLTSEGRRYFDCFMPFYEKVHNCEGNLTSIGQDQHRTIASRMYRRFPEVFEGNTRVEAVSTEPSRCIMSMWSFLSALQGLDEELEISADASLRYCSWLQPLSDSNPYVIAKRPRYNKKAVQDIEYFRRDAVDWEGIAGRFFVSPEAVRSRLKINPMDFLTALYFIDADTQCLDHDRDLFADFLSNDEKYLIWKTYAVKLFVLLANYEGSDNLTVDYSAFTLEQIISAANEDLADNDVQIRLRFGHDSGVMPLLTFLNINGFGRSTSSLEEAVEIFPTYEIPMGCSLQMIFYRNAAGKVIFKVLLNEKEATLPLNPIESVYYDWEEFQAYYQPRIAASKAKIDSARKEFISERQLNKDLRILKAVDWKWRDVPGTSIQTGHASLKVFGGRQSISLARFPMKDHKISVVNAEAPRAGTTSQIAARSKALAAINGSYFSIRTKKNATLVKDEGKIIPSETVGPQKHSNGIFRIRDKRGHDVDICIMTDTLSCGELVKDWREAIVSGPVLLESGEKMTYVPASSSQIGDLVIDDKFYKRFYTGRHPRTAVGYSQDGWLYFVVVDGRFPGKADGMSIFELQTLVQSLGLHEAMNLDGGGSSTLWTKPDGVLNHPSDNKIFDRDGERPVTNILAVY